MKINKLSAFIFIIVIIIFILYAHVYHHNRIDPIVLYINNNSSIKQVENPIISYDFQDKFAKDYVIKVDEKAQKPSCLIMIRTTDGGKGNRMFLFASAYGLARLHQCELYVAPYILVDLRSIFVLNLNNTPVRLITDDSVFNRTGIYGRYSSCTLFDDLLRIPLNSNLTLYEMIGFYQAFGYFVKYKDEIAYLYQFNQAAIKNNIPLVEQLLKAVWSIPLNFNNYTEDNVTHPYLKSLLTRPKAPLIPVTWVGIHIRRTDFLTFFKIDTSMEYLTLAMNYYRRKYFNCRFLIASDDKEYAKKNLGSDSDVFITPQSFHSGDDLAALALCEHTIVTAGSYGWWAAWLAGGNVVHDLNYPVKFQQCTREHYFPPWFVFPHNTSLPQPTNSISDN